VDNILNKPDYSSSPVCIVTPRVSGMGGAQLYALRRIQFLKKKGIHAMLLVTDDTNFILEKQFGDVSILVRKDLAKPVFYYSDQNLDKIIHSICSDLHIFSQNLVLESHSLRLSIWCELIASRLKCKHIIYPLNETSITSWEFNPVKDFFIWKQVRTELLGASKPSLRVILGRYYRESKAVYINIGFDPNEITAISCPNILGHFDKDSFKIGTISRLSKPYIEVLLNEVRWVAANNPLVRFTFIVAGDDVDRKIRKKLTKKYPSTPNMSILFTGYLNPLGKDFFQGLDIYIGMATSVINSAALKCASITVDPITSLSAGFFGITSKDTMFASKEELRPIRYWLQKVITNSSLIEEARIAGHKHFLEEYNNESCMTLIQSLIGQSSRTKDYFSFNKGYTSSFLLKKYFILEGSRFYSLLREFTGVVFPYNRIRSIFQRLF